MLRESTESLVRGLTVLPIGRSTQKRLWGVTYRQRNLEGMRQILLAHIEGRVKAQGNADAPAESPCPLPWSRYVGPKRSMNAPPAPGLVEKGSDARTHAPLGPDFPDENATTIGTGSQTWTSYFYRRLRRV